MLTRFNPGGRAGGLWPRSRPFVDPRDDAASPRAQAGAGRGAGAGLAAGVGAEARGIELPDGVKDLNDRGRGPDGRATFLPLVKEADRATAHGQREDDGAAETH